MGDWGVPLRSRYLHPKRFPCAIPSVLHDGDRREGPAQQQWSQVGLVCFERKDPAAQEKRALSLPRPDDSQQLAAAGRDDWRVPYGGDRGCWLLTAEIRDV